MSDENKIQDEPCKTCGTCFQFLTRPPEYRSGAPIAGVCDLHGTYIYNIELACDAYVPRPPEEGE